MSVEQYNFLATCSIGCEPVLEKELKSLGFSRVKASRNLVRFSGTLQDGMRACLWSRCTSRVLLPLDSVHAPSAEEIYKQCMKLPWEEHLSSRSTFAVHGIGTNRGVRNSAFLAQKVKDAIADRLRNRYGKRPNVDRNDPDVSINAHLAGARLDLSLDLSGDSLHKRGWRIEETQAPIKESLAATILLAAGYDGKQPLVDPMCGSGTFLIEAAEIALGLAPGHRRRFAFERWPMIPKATLDRFEDMRREGATPKNQEIPPIWGSDIERRMIRIAGLHVEGVGLADYIRLEKKGAMRASFPENGSLLVTNPPYGERLKPEKDEDLPVLYKKLGEKWRDLGDGKLAVICAHEQFRKSFGLKPYKVLDLFNGPIRSPLFLYRIGGIWRENSQS